MPSNFPSSNQLGEVADQYQNFSDGAAAAEGSWASGPTPDGNGESNYHDGPTTSGPMSPPTTSDPRLYGTTGGPDLVEKEKGTVKDLLQPSRPGARACRHRSRWRVRRARSALSDREATRRLSGQTPGVLSVDLALSLREAGLVWTPAQGDRFVLPGRGMDEQVFVLSDMTVEVHQLPRGRVVGFNGTTEWALDSVRVEDALWLPREDQLRDLLGTRFARLERSASGWAVELAGPDERHAADDAEDAYGSAVLRTLGG